VSSTLSTRYPAGSLIAGRYEIVRKLGHGGMAEVYLATDRMLARPVAVKVIRDRLAEDRRLAARFRREARAAAALNHRGIVSVHDVGMDGANPYIVMEYVRGRNLAEALQHEGPFAAARVAEIGMALAESVAVAHDAGIVHHDLKPGNVMLTEKGEVKVLDFGIAHAIQWTPLTEEAAVHGTAEYMSPERIRGADGDPRSDVYSLGAVLYELATGRPPFAGDTPLATAYRHLEEEPAPPHVVRPDLPPELSTILMRCLAKRPDDRYRRSDDLAADLGRFRAGELPSTSPVPVRPTRRLWEDEAQAPPRPRRRWVWIAGGLAAALVAATLGFVLIDGGGPNGGRKTQLRPPTRVTAEGDCGGFLDPDVMVRWVPTRTRSADGYNVYRASASGGELELVGRVGGRGTTVLEDDGVGTNDQYFYVVRATDEDRISPPSGQAQAKTPFFCLG
jgi:serine/threonine-protein kinase